MPCLSHFVRLAFLLLERSTSAVSLFNFSDFLDLPILLFTCRLRRGFLERVY